MQNEFGRPRIATQRSRRIDGCDRCSPGRNQLFCRARKWKRQAPLVVKASDAVAPLSGLRRLVRVKIIETDAGMKVQHPQRLFLLLQVLEDACQYDVFQYIGMISGVIGVAVIHPDK